jgi:hypothetical protein
MVRRFIAQGIGGLLARLHARPRLRRRLETLVVASPALRRMAEWALAAGHGVAAPVQEGTARAFENTDSTRLGDSARRLIARHSLPGRR